MVRSSCFSFESAHNHFKTLVQSQNFKNLLFFLARRQQLRECSFFGDKNENPSSHSLFSTECKHGVAGNITVEMVERLGNLFEKFFQVSSLLFIIFNDCPGSLFMELSFVKVVLLLLMPFRKLKCQCLVPLKRSGLCVILCILKSK